MLYHKCRCGKIIPQNIKQCKSCEEKSEQESRHMIYNRYRRNKKAAEFYVSADWRKIRAAVINRYDGMDIYALYVLGEIRTADMVHHIVPLEENWSLRFDMKNLIPLSSHSHGIIEAIYKDRQKKSEMQKLLYELMERYRTDQGEGKKV